MAPAPESHRRPFHGTAPTPYSVLPTMSAATPSHHLRYISSSTAALVGCPSTAGQGKAGVEHGPNALVEAGLPRQLEQLGWHVEFTGHQNFEAVAPPDLVVKDTDLDGMKKPRTVSAITKHVADVVAGHSKAGKIPVTLGGDHSLVRYFFEPNTAASPLSVLLTCILSRALALC